LVLAGVVVAIGATALVVTVLKGTDSAEPPAGSRPLLRADFESGNFSQWEGVQQAAPGRASVVTSPHVQGSYAGRFEVREGEFIGSDAPTRNRTEAVLSAAGNRHKPKEGDDWWYRWWFYLPASTPMPAQGTDQGMTITQWVTMGDAGPDFEQLGIFQFRDTKASADPGPGHVEFLYTDSDARTDGIEHDWRKAASAVTRNAWHSILLHRKWSASEAAGFIEIYYDDVKQTLADGTTKMSMRTLTPGYSAYMKQGIYRGNDIGGTAVIYFDGLRIGTTRASVQE
jgi:hypothetical protein